MSMIGEQTLPFVLIPITFKMPNPITGPLWDYPISIKQKNKIIGFFSKKKYNIKGFYFKENK
jgi:hypothetical protein